MQRRFVVDEWRCHSDVYFLTHLHADHTDGLSAQWCRGPLYCSEVTAMLLLTKFKGFNPALIHILDLGSPTVVSHGNASASTLEVTAIDADHCPGAVMYVFHGDFGCILHTGDFRWNDDRSTLEKRKNQLTQALGGIQVDLLYVDNTFCNPMFDFPSRNSAAGRVIDIINSYPEHDIVIGIDNLGKEELLVCIAERLKTKICIWPQRLKIMHLLQLPDVFTTDTTVTRIRAVPRYTVSSKTLKLLNELRPTVGILPTGCFCLCNPATEKKFISKLCSEGCYKAQHEKATENLVSSPIHVVPYSLHSCFTELRDFFKFVQPKDVSGIVKSAGLYNINPSQQLAQSKSSSKVICGNSLHSENERLALIAQPEVSFQQKVESVQSRKSLQYGIRRKRERLRGRGAKLYSTC